MPDFAQRDNLLERTRELVLEVAHEAIPGKRKARKAARQIAKWIDDNTDTGALEPFDRPVFTLIGLGLVEFAYRELKAAGELPG